jgi:undecaprenyl-phosphate glucose phosphotransferase
MGRRGIDGGIHATGRGDIAGFRTGLEPKDRRPYMKHNGESQSAAQRNAEADAAPRRVVLVGARRDTRQLARRLAKDPWSGLPIIGYVDAGHAGASSSRPRNRHLALHAETDPVPVLGSIDQLERVLDRAGATHVLVAVSGDGEIPSRRHGHHLTNSDVSVQWVSVDAGRLDLGELGAGLSNGTAQNGHYHASAASASNGMSARRSVRRRARRTRTADRFSRLRFDRASWDRKAKRAMDIIVSSLLLTALSPLFAVVAVAILVSSGRPIFYRQERAGQGGRLFRMIKFRSMKLNAEQETGPIWASDHDSRCTRIGDWLRHSNIDELPQLFNVLRGDMSLVGPRPERPMFIKEFRGSIPDYDLRHAVPGGMTGWAQVHGWRGRTSLRKRIQYDLDYIERWSTWLDLRILLMTIQHVLYGKTNWNDGKRGGRTAS